MKRAIEKLSNTDQLDTKEQVFRAAEKLFAERGFQKVTVRDIATEGGVNIASVNYYFGSKTNLANAIFKQRAAELNRERLNLLKDAVEVNKDQNVVRGILRALFAPPIKWLEADDHRKRAIQVILRGRNEGTTEMRQALKKHVTHLEPFATELKRACPELPEEVIYWRLHFCLGIVHNNRPAEFERLAQLSRGATKSTNMENLLSYILDFAEAGFAASNIPRVSGL